MDIRFCHPGSTQASIEYWLSLRGIVAAAASKTKHDWGRPDPWAFVGNSHLNTSSSHKRKWLERVIRKASLELGKKKPFIPSCAETLWRTWVWKRTVGWQWVFSCWSTPALYAWGWDPGLHGVPIAPLPDVTPRGELSSFRNILWHSAWGSFRSADLKWGPWVEATTWGLLSCHRVETADRSHLEEERFGLVPNCQGHSLSQRGGRPWWLRLLHPGERELCNSDLFTCQWIRKQKTWQEKARNSMAPKDPF